MFDFSIGDFADIIPNNDTFITGVRDALETSMLMCEEKLPDPSSGCDDAGASPSPAQKIRRGEVNTCKLQFFDKKYTNLFVASKNSSYTNIVNVYGKRHSYDFFTNTRSTASRKNAALVSESHTKQHPDVVPTSNTPERLDDGVGRKRGRSDMISTVSASGICCACCSKLLTPDDLSRIPMDALNLALLPQRV